MLGTNRQPFELKLHWILQLST